MQTRRTCGEGSLYRRRDGLWTAQYTAPDGRRRYLYSRSRTDAAARLRNAIAAPPSADTPYGEWLVTWLETYIRPTVRPRTYKAYHTEIHRHILPALGTAKLGDLREDALQRFLTDLLNSYSRTTVAHLRTRLKTSLEKAVDLELIPKNPARKLVLPPPTPSERLIFTPEEQRHFELAAETLIERRWLAALPLLLLRTGLRCGEGLGLRLDDVDLERRELHVRRTVGRISAPGQGSAPICVGEPKTRQSRRTLPLDEATASLLRRAIADREALVERSRDAWRVHPSRWCDEGYLFLTRNGGLLDARDARRLLLEIERIAELPPVTLHGLRHTFATRWVENGLDIKSLSELLGHADTQMTLNTYAHSLPDQKRACVERLGAILRP